MIAIVNRTDSLSNGMGMYGTGRQIHTLQINSKVLTTFEHIFEDGLAVCLEKAAKAAYKYEKSEKKDSKKLKGKKCSVCSCFMYSEDDYCRYCASLMKPQESEVAQ